MIGHYENHCYHDSTNMSGRSPRAHGWASLGRLTRTQLKDQTMDFKFGNRFRLGLTLPAPLSEKTRAVKLRSKVYERTPAGTCPLGSSGARQFYRLKAARYLGESDTTGQPGQRSTLLTLDAVDPACYWPRIAIYGTLPT